MATAPKFRIDVDIHNLLTNTAQTPRHSWAVQEDASTRGTTTGSRFFSAAGQNSAASESE